MIHGNNVIVLLYHVVSINIYLTWLDLNWSPWKYSYGLYVFIFQYNAILNTWYRSIVMLCRSTSIAIKKSNIKNYHNNSIIEFYLISWKFVYLSENNFFSRWQWIQVFLIWCKYHLIALIRSHPLFLCAFKLFYVYAFNNEVNRSWSRTASVDIACGILRKMLAFKGLFGKQLPFIYFNLVIYNKEINDRFLCVMNHIAANYKACVGNGSA